MFLDLQAGSYLTRKVPILLIFLSNLTLEENEFNEKISKMQFELKEALDKLQLRLDGFSSEKELVDMLASRAEQSASI